MLAVQQPGFRVVDQRRAVARADLDKQPTDVRRMFDTVAKRSIDEAPNNDGARGRRCASVMMVRAA